MYGLAGSKRGKEFSNRSPRHRVHQIRCNVTDRLQNKAALRQTRMRNFKVVFAYDTVAVQQKIKIHSAWPLWNSPDPIEGFVFDHQ